MDREARVEDLLDRAQRLPEEERSRFLEAACEGDPALRAEVEDLLRFADAADGDDKFLRSPLRYPRDDASAPERIADYSIIRKIGEGGMGVVYEAEQSFPRRRVALKVIRPGFASPQLRRRFGHEAEVLGRLQHPGIAQIYEAGVDETVVRGGFDYKRPFLAMELVQGERLDIYSKRDDVDLTMRLRLFVRICEAVQHAHERGVLHRDLKPGNILVDERGQPKILDFGVARVLRSNEMPATAVTSTGQVLGTLQYMSPEQARGKGRELDARSDVYTLGVVLYEMLSGRLPYTVDNLSVPEAIRRIVENEPSHLSSLDSTFRGDLDIIAGKALEKEPKRRYSSAAAMAADCRRYLDRKPIVARRSGAFYRLRKFSSRNRALVGGMVATLLALAAGFTVATLFAVAVVRKNVALQRITYRTTIRAALDALGNDDRPLALEILNVADIPARLRGWEWQYVNARATPDGLRVEPPRHSRFAPQVAFDGGELVYRAEGFTYRFDAATGAMLQGRAVEMPGVVEPGSTGVIHGPDGDYAVYRHFEGADRVALFRRSGRSCGEPHGLGAVFGPAGSGLVQITGLPIRANAFEPILLWDLESCTQRASIPTDLPIGFTLDGASSLSVKLMDRDLEVFVHDTSSGRPRTHWPIDHEPLSSAVSASGQVAIGFHTGTVEIFDLHTGEQVGSIPAHRGRVTGIAFTPDARRLVTCGADHRIRQWDVGSGREIAAYTISHEGTRATFDDRGRRLAVASTGGAVTILDTALRQWPWILRKHETYVYAVAFDPAGSSFATGDFEGRVFIWNARTYALLASLENPYPYIQSVRFSPDGSRLLIVSRAPLVKGPSQFQVSVWDLGSRSLLASRVHESGGLSPETGLPLDPGATRVLLSWDLEREAALVWDVTDGTVTLMPSAGLSSDEAKWLGAERYLAIHDSTRPDGIVILDLVGNVRRALGVGLKYRSFALGNQRRGRRLFAATLPSTHPENGNPRVLVGLWDLRTGERLGTLKGHTQEVLTVAFSPDDRRIATGSRDTTIRLWDTETMEEVARLEGHSLYIKDLAFSPDGAQLVSASGDRTVHVWDTVPYGERLQRQSSDPGRGDQ